MWALKNKKTDKLMEECYDDGHGYIRVFEFRDGCLLFLSDLIFNKNEWIPVRVKVVECND